MTWWLQLNNKNWGACKNLSFKRPNKQKGRFHAICLLEWPSSFNFSILVWNKIHTSSHRLNAPATFAVTQQSSKINLKAQGLGSSCHLCKNHHCWWHHFVIRIDTIYLAPFLKTACLSGNPFVCSLLIGCWFLLTSKIRLFSDKYIRSFLGRGEITNTIKK